MHNAIFVGVGAAHAYKRLAAARHLRAAHKVELTARSAYLPRAGAFRAYLPVEIGSDAGVYRHHVVVLRYDIGIVHIRKGIANIARIIVEPLIKFVASDRKAENALAVVQRFLCVCELSGLEHGKIPVRAQLRVHAKILEITVGDKLAEGVRHTADAKLHARSVLNVRQQQICDLNVGFRWSRIRHLKQRRIAGLNDIVNLGYVYPRLLTAFYARYVAVDFDNDDLRIIRYAF